MRHKTRGKDVCVQNLFGTLKTEDKWSVDRRIILKCVYLKNTMWEDVDRVLG
jgi:hypothetical protein